MKWFSVATAALISGCAATAPMTGPSTQRIDRGEYKADTSHVSMAQNDRVRFLVLHYTALDDEKSLQVLTTGGNVSAHYLAPSTPPMDGGKPVVLQLVSEDKRAWHAGLSEWGNRNNINDTSIGIEIVNLGYIDSADGLLWYPFGQAQIDLVTRVTKDIVQRYGIEPVNVLAHSDIAPLRKSDPGPLFPWKALYEAGVGAWPDAQTVEKYLAGRDPRAMASVSNIQTALEKYGYTIPQTGQLDDDTRKIIRAFQMHFRAENISGDPDAQTEAIALALIEKYK